MTFVLAANAEYIRTEGQKCSPSPFLSRQRDFLRFCKIRESCMICQLFILPLPKVGCISAKHSSKLDVLCSICTTFAL